MSDTLVRPAEPVLTRIPNRDDPEPAHPRTLGGMHGGVWNVGGAAIAAVCITLLLFGRLAPFSGLIGFVVVAYAIFLVALGVLVSLDDDGRAVRDRLMATLFCSAAVLTVLALA